MVIWHEQLHIRDISVPVVDGDALKSYVGIAKAPPCAWRCCAHTQNNAARKLREHVRVAGVARRCDAACALRRKTQQRMAITRVYRGMCRC